MEIIVRLAYIYLFVLILLNFKLCISIGFKTDKAIESLNPLLYFLHLFIFGLLFVQAYQVGALLLGAVSDYWYITVLCKNSSLLAYMLILKLIDWCVDTPCNPSCSI